MMNTDREQARIPHIIGDLHIPEYQLLSYSSILLICVPKPHMYYETKGM